MTAESRALNQTDALSSFMDSKDHSTPIIWSIACLVAFFAHVAMYSLVQVREAKPVSPPITVSFISPPVESTPPPPSMPRVDERKPNAAPVPAAPKAVDRPIEPQKEVPKAAAEPIAVEAATGKGVSVAVGSPDGVEGAKPVSGSAQSSSNHASSDGDGAVFDPRAYHASTIARVNRHKQYPEKARFLAAEGRMMVKIAIDADGQIVSGPVIMGRGTGHPILDEEGLRMVRAAAPYPPPEGNVSFPYVIFVPIQFQLDQA